MSVLKIQFKNEGQEDLHWEVDHNGQVIDQAAEDKLFVGCYVVNPFRIRKNDQVCFYDQDGSLKRKAIPVEATVQITD